MGTYANSEDSDEMQHNAAFHQGLHCLLGLNQPSGTEIHHKWLIFNNLNDINSLFDYLCWPKMLIFNRYMVNVPILRTLFFFLFSNKMLVIRAGSHKMLVRIANREALNGLERKFCAQFEIFQKIYIFR